jgi:hypothetical protein
MVEEFNMRLIFRPTKEQFDEVNRLMELGIWKTKSELMRRIFQDGLESAKKYVEPMEKG